jgi:hypothetical protein
LTTKGDIWSYSNTDARFPVSTTPGQVITVDTAEPFGFKWEDIPYAPQGEVAFNYNYSDNTSPVGIATGELRLDNTDLSLATKLYISDVTNAGNDVTVFLSEFVQENYLSLYQTTPGNAAISYQITAGSTPVDQGTYWEYDITFIYETAADAYTNGEPVQLIKVANPADRLPEGGLVGQVMVKTGADPYDLQWGGDINFYYDSVVDAGNLSVTGLAPGSEYLTTPPAYFDLFTDNLIYSHGGGNAGWLFMAPTVHARGTRILNNQPDLFGMGALFISEVELTNSAAIEGLSWGSFYCLHDKTVYNYSSNTTAGDFAAANSILVQPTFKTTGTGSWTVGGSGAGGSGLTVRPVYEGNTTCTRYNGFVAAGVSLSAPAVVNYYSGFCAFDVPDVLNSIKFYLGSNSALPAGRWGIYQELATADLNTLARLKLESDLATTPDFITTFPTLHIPNVNDRTGTAVNNAAFDANGYLVEASPVLSQVDTSWVQQLAEEFIKVTGSTTPTAWTTIHTETLGTDEAVRGSFLAVAKRTDAKGYSYSEKKYVVWEDAGSITEDDIELYEVGSGIAFAETRININGMNIEFQVRSVTGDWDWDVTIFNKGVT